MKRYLSLQTLTVILGVTGLLSMGLVWPGHSEDDQAPATLNSVRKNSTVTVSNSQVTQPGFSRQSAIYQRTASPVAFDLPALQLDGWADNNVQARGMAAQRLYLYQINGYVPEPIWAAGAESLLDSYALESLSLPSTEALEVTLRAEAARCGIPVISEHMVNQTLISREFILIQAWMMLLKLPAQQVFESSLYHDEINWQQLTPCEHFKVETAFQ